MTELISNEQEVLSTTKTGRHSRFTALQDVFIAREIASANTHTPNYGETKKRFKTVARQVNLNAAFQDDLVTWKAAQDRYKRLQEQYCEMYDKNQQLSGVGQGEMRELADFLMTLREARDDWMSEKQTVKTAEKKKEVDKKRLGQALVTAATKRKASGSTGGNSDDMESIGGDDVSGTDTEVALSSAKKRRTVRARPELEDGEMGRFGLHVKEADLARVDLEREKLAFEQERVAADRIERQNEREM